MAALLIVLALPAWTVPGTPAPPPPSTSGLPLTGHVAAASTPIGPSPVVHALNLSLSYDWDGMGLLGGRGIPTSYVGGEGSALAIDDLALTGVLFGGEGALGLTNFSLALNETSAVWTNVTGPVAPSPRANFSFASDPVAGFAVLFGGITSLSSQACDNSTWIYWFSNATWVNETRPFAPPPRESGAFAVDPHNATAVLVGGIDPDFVGGGGTGTVVWNDTWTLNLTTFTWTARHPRVAPSPHFGASMAWVPPVGQFLLWGGCFTGCTNAMWSYTPGANWSIVRPNGSAPSGRAAATFAWGPDYGLLVMFGGFSLLGQMMEAHNDTYVYQPLQHAWSWIQGPPDPLRRFGAPGAWLSANNCPGLFLIGGSTGTVNPPADLSFMDSNPDTQPGCNTWGSDQVGSGNGGSGNGLPPGCVANADVSVRVLSAVTGKTLSNATVSLSGYCGPATATTNARGFANFTSVPSWLTNILASALGYHSNQTQANFSANVTTHLTLKLTPLPFVSVRTLGVEVGGIDVDLVGVPIWIDGAPTTNVSGPGGWWNTTDLSLPIGANTFSAQLPKYSTPTRSIFFPYTGSVWVNLTLSAYGPFKVLVTIAGTGQPIGGADGQIVAEDAGSTLGSTLFTTPPDGLVTNVLPAGNYSVGATATGFLANVTPEHIDHPWANVTMVHLNLTPEAPFTLDVRLVDAGTQRPIPDGSVLLGAGRVNVTDAAGWANFTKIAPAGTYGVAGIAPDYLGNRTSVVFSYFLPPVKVVRLNLTPLHPCPPAGCAKNGSNGSGPLFALIPPGFWGLAILTTSPLLLIVGAIAYFAGTRRRVGAEARG